MLRESILRRLCALPVLAVALAGCGGSAGTNTVSGTVTQGGRPVTGSVVFVDGANKEYASPIAPDGKYHVRNLPAGPMKVLVRGTPKVPPGPKTHAAIVPQAPTGGITPNAKYATAAGGLTVTVTGGDQSYDIDLK